MLLGCVDTGEGPADKRVYGKVFATSFVGAGKNTVERLRIGDRFQKFGSVVVDTHKFELLIHNAIDSSSGGSTVDSFGVNVLGDVTENVLDDGVGITEIRAIGEEEVDKVDVDAVSTVHCDSRTRDNVAVQEGGVDA